MQDATRHARIDYFQLMKAITGDHEAIGLPSIEDLDDDAEEKRIRKATGPTTEELKANLDAAVKQERAEWSGLVYDGNLQCSLDDLVTRTLARVRRPL